MKNDLYARMERTAFLLDVAQAESKQCPSARNISRLEYFAYEAVGALREAMIELARLRRGDFTADEIHNFCHNLHSTVNAQAFADGCAAEQRRLYGCAPDRDALQQLQQKAGSGQSPSGIDDP